MKLPTIETGEVNLTPPELGVHTWCLEAAWKCRGAGLTPGAAVAAIRNTEGQLRAGRKFAFQEVERAVTRAYDTKPVVARKSKAKTVAKFQDRVATNAVEMEDLRTMSPWPRPELITAEMAVDLLFPDDGALLCMAKETRKAYTATRDHWLKKEHLHSLLVPNLATSMTGKTQDGHLSKRCNQQFPDRTYAVVEFDDGASLAEQAGRALYLGKILPLTLVCHSGNKSLHCWFLAAGEDEDNVLSFYDVAISLGADRVGRTRCQLMRTPGAWRVFPGGFEETESTLTFSAEGIRQKVHYFNWANAWTSTH